MKCSKELKRYISKNRKFLKVIHWDDMMIIRKMKTCKNWYKRIKKVNYND